MKTLEQRIKDLKAMHNTMMNINDEEYYCTWIVLGVPDGAREEDFKEFAEDDEIYYGIESEFAKLMKMLSEEDEDEYNKACLYYLFYPCLK